MATATKTLVYDNSTDIRFGQWAGGIEDAFVSTAGWSRTTDTGQSGMKPGTITNVARTSTTCTVTFTAGPVYYVGQVVNVAAVTNTTVNNAAATLLTVSSTQITYTQGSGTLGSTADTGTINPARPTASNFKYQIFKMADTLQSTAPVFLKMEFGQSSAGTVPWIAITVGTGTDGAGTITGITTSRLLQNIATTGATGATTHNCYFSGDTSRFMMCLYQDLGANNAFCFQIERSHDTTGADTSDYFTVFAIIVNGLYVQSLYGILGTAPSGETANAPVSHEPVASTFNSNVWFSPLFPIIGQMGNPMIMGAMKSTDITNLSTPSIKFYGTSHTLIAFNASPFTTITSSTACATLLRFD